MDFSAAKLKVDGDFTVSDMNDLDRIVATNQDPDEDLVTWVNGSLPYRYLYVGVRTLQEFPVETTSLNIRLYTENIKVWAPEVGRLVDPINDPDFFSGIRFPWNGSPRDNSSFAPYYESTVPSPGTYEVALAVYLRSDSINVLERRGQLSRVVSVEVPA